MTSDESEKILANICRDICKDMLDLSNKSANGVFIDDEILDAMKIRQNNFENLIKSIQRENKIDEILNEDIREEEI